MTSWILIIAFGVLLYMMIDLIPDQMRWIGIILMAFMIIAQFVKI